MASKAALKSYAEGWKRSRAFWAVENAHAEAASAGLWARERAIIAAERAKATPPQPKHGND